MAFAAVKLENQAPVCYTAASHMEGRCIMDEAWMEALRELGLQN